MSTGIRARTEFETWLHCFPAGDIGQVSVSENGDGNYPRGTFLTLNDKRTYCLGRRSVT